VLCAFCKLPRRVYNKRDISVLEILLIFIATGLFSYLIWDSTNFKSLIFFLVMMVTLQVFYRMRWRQSVRCHHCHFDPILYKSQPEAAAQNVKAFMRAAIPGLAIILPSALYHHFAFGKKASSLMDPYFLELRFGFLGFRHFAEWSRELLLLMPVKASKGQFSCRER